MIGLSISIAAIIGGLTMGWGHYLGRQIIGNGLGPPWTYVIGVGLGILTPFAGWCLWAWLTFGELPVWLPLVALVAIIAGAGLGTVASYLVDWYTDYRAKARKGERLLPDGHRD